MPWPIRATRCAGRGEAEIRSGNATSEYLQACGPRGGGRHPDREEDGADLESGAPFILQDVEADPAELIDVRVVDLCEEAHLRQGTGLISMEDVRPSRTAREVDGPLRAGFESFGG